MNKDFAFAFHKNVIALSAEFLLETWNGFSTTITKELDLNPSVNQITKGY